MATVQEHARRLRQHLDEADEAGYGVNAWYFYLNRRDVEALVNAALAFKPDAGRLQPSGPPRSGH